MSIYLRHLVYSYLPLEVKDAMLGDEDEKVDSNLQDEADMRRFLFMMMQQEENDDIGRENSAEDPFEAF